MSSASLQQKRRECPVGEFYEFLTTQAHTNPSVIFQLITRVIIQKHFPEEYVDSGECEYTVEGDPQNIRVPLLEVWAVKDTRRKKAPFQYHLNAEEETVCAKMFGSLLEKKNLQPVP
jgi:hypothetical protein